MNKFQQALDNLFFRATYKGIFKNKRLQRQKDLLQELVDKATPKKVIIDKTINGDDCFCPNCKTSLVDVRNDAYKSFISKHCSWCGQALDWGEDE